MKVLNLALGFRSFAAPGGFGRRVIGLGWRWVDGLIV